MQPIILPDRPRCELSLVIDKPRMHKPGWSCQTWLGDDGQHYAQAVKGGYPDVLVEWYWLRPGA